MNAIEILDFFYSNQSSLNNVSMLYFGQGSNEFNYHKILSYRDNSKYSIDSINGKQPFLWFDSVTAKKMVENSTSDISYNSCILLDTQMVSYIMKLFKTNNPKKNSFLNDTYDILHYLIGNNVDFSAFPYLIENSTKISSPETLIPMFENLSIYDFCMDLDFSSYVNFFKDKNSIMNLNFQKTDNTISMIKEMSKDPDTLQLLKIQKAIHSLLLYTALLSLKSDKTFPEKVKLLFEFSHNSLSLFLERELVICYRFLKNPNDSLVQKFFKKIKPGSKNISRTLLSMSWDLFHIRMIVQNISTTNNTVENFDMHSLLTFDKGLSEVLQIHPVKALIFIDSVPHWIHEADMSKIITEVNVIEYYEPKKRKERLLSNPYVNHSKLISNIENQITEFEK